MQDIGKVIRRYRKAAKLSQVELAKLSGVDQTHISKIEQGGRLPSLDLLSQFVRLLHIPAAELMAPNGAAAPPAEQVQNAGKYEKELMDITRGLTARRKQKVLTYAREQLKLMSMKSGRTSQAK